MDKERTIHQQLIDSEKNFDRPAIEKIATILKNVQKEYFSVAIIGVQNSGKSTLLNHLFGTNFDVLKGLEGERTTRGILLSLDKQENIIVVDVEGNDAMDRAQEQDYEKMVATYALITADVLIINIWLKSLGGHTGSQYETLKTIMEICVDQFKQGNPKTILYCVRDFNQEYDNEWEIKSKINRDVNQIWDRVPKPEEYKKYEDKTQKFFRLEVVVLSRYREGYPQKFLNDVEKLRVRFVDPKSQDYIFSKQKTQYNLPIKDLPELAQNAWKTILTHKKLNLPNQKIQLASFRCSAIMNEIQQAFSEEIHKLQSQDKANFGDLKDKYLEKYREETYQYNKEIVEEKKGQLLISFDEKIKKVIIQKMNEKIRNFEEEFRTQAKSIKKNQASTLEDELKNLISAKIQALIQFIKFFNYQVPNRKEKIDQLTKNLQEKFQETKNTILLSVKSQFETQSSRTIRLLASDLIKNHFGINFWSQALKALNTTNISLINGYRQNYLWITGEQLEAVDFDNMQEQIQFDFKDSIKTELQKTLITRVFDYFKERIVKDEEDHELNFNLMTDEQIGIHFDRTRDATNLLINRLNQFHSSQYRRSSFMDEIQEGNHLFESTWLSTAIEQIDKKMINQYETIMRRKKEGDMKSVPPWLLFFIVFFVYDDIWFSKEDQPYMYYIVGIPIILMLTFAAIGQGKALKQLINMVVDKFRR